MSQTQRVDSTQQRMGLDGDPGDPVARTRAATASIRVDGRPSSGRHGHALLVANRLPWPLDDGWKVRTFHVLRGVARQARVTALLFHPSTDTDGIEAARSAFGPAIRLVTVDPPPAYGPIALLRGLATRYPVHIWNQESRPLRSKLRELLANEPVDFVVSESTFMARYLDMVPRSVPRFIDTHNIDSVTFRRYVDALRPGARRAYAAITARKLRSFEAATFHDADGVWVCSEIERGLVGEMAPATRAWTVPNGVDTSYFDPGPRPEPVADRMLFFGRLDYYPNVDGLRWFVSETLPRIRRTRPGARLQVVGAGAGREIEAFADVEGVDLIGRVGDVRQALLDAAVVVVPLRVGGGTRLKILEALSMERAVVTTTVGAEGLDVVDGTHLVEADEPDAMASAVVSLLADQSAARALGENGRALVRQRYDWSRVDDLVAASLADVLPSGSE